MQFSPLPFRAPLQDYHRQAKELLEAWRAGHSTAVEIFRHSHPRFLDKEISWLPSRELTEEEVRSTRLEIADAQLALARGYNFLDWSRLAEYVEAVTPEDSPVGSFEAAVEAVVNGELAALKEMLRRDPALVRARSVRVTCFDPPVHRATLLHYVAANGVENCRQKTPPNAVEIATALLKAGAEPDALANLYGGECTTMTLLVSSCHPANAGVQVALVDTLVDFGAAVEPRGTGNWASPLITALVFGYLDAAQALVRRGAQVSSLAAAAGLGRLEDVQRSLPASSGEERHCALALACALGQAEVAGVLLDAGGDPNRHNPGGFHAHSTPLHQAALAGQLAVVRLLVERGARLDIRDTIYRSTPLGWALHAGRTEIADYLKSRGAAE
jgi:ankyrin repeat protein